MPLSASFSSTPSSNSSSSSNPLWPQGHPRHMVDSWLQSTYGSSPLQRGCREPPAFPSIASRKKVKWSFHLGTTAFTSGHKPTSTPAFGPQYHNFTGSSEPRFPVPDIMELGLNDQGNSETASAARHPLRSRQNYSVPSYAEPLPNDGEVALEVC